MKKSPKTAPDTSLIVEDNPDVRPYTRDQLGKNFHIIEAENGAAGLKMAQSEMPALVITDLMMPDMDGLALTRSLKKDLRTSHIPVIMLTIEENLDDETFGVVELAAKVALSRSQLHRKLTAATGHGPNETIRNLRLERAKELLEKGAGNASEVAFMVGFNSLAYF